ncbi:MAG: DUF4097 family beta strand repeat-containing protein [Bryobacteraceae bacterium]
MNKRIEKMARRAVCCFVLCFGFQALAREEYTRNFDKTTPLAAGQPVRVQHRLGDVTIRTQSKPEVIVHAVIRSSASDMAEAKRFADSIRIEVQPSGSAVLVETQYPKQELGGFLGLRNISYSVNLDITMPETAPLEVKNSFGAVTIADLRASGDITTSHGKLLFRNGRGSQKLENSFSSIEVAGNSGDMTLSNNNGTVDVSDVSGTINIKNRFAKVTVSRSGGGTIVSGNGQVRASNIAGALRITNSFGPVNADTVKGNLTVNNQNGEVEANAVTGSAELNTSFGGVRFSDVSGQVSVRAQNSTVKGRNAGDLATVENSFAPVELSGIRKGARVLSKNGAVTVVDIGDDLTVRTSFAAVHADRIGGAVDVENQNGSVDVAMNSHPGCRPVTIRSSYAGLRIHVPSDASYAVAAKTSYGQIHSDFPVLVQGALGGDSLSGKIGNGSCVMQLNNQNGNIEILRNH